MDKRARVPNGSKSCGSEHTLQFYGAIDREKVYAVETDPYAHPFYSMLKPFVDKWQLQHKKCLEIGSSKGLFQDIVPDYTGIDVSENLSQYYHKKYMVATGARLPLPESSFDAVFTYATHEHIPDIDTALNEIIRVLKPGGVCLFAPAWHTRPWFARGLQVRPYPELTLQEKITKLSIPFRDSVLIRWPLVFLRRVLRLMIYLIRRNPVSLRYKRLKANYEIFWQSDSDACNSLDPFDLILWFRSRGMICHGNNKLWKVLFVRTYALELQKPGA